MKRVAVVGGGVAGAAALISLQEMPFEVWHIAPPYDGLPHIGETLSASAGPVLKELGLWDVFMDHNFPTVQSSFSSWGSERLVEQHTMMHHRQSGWFLDRKQFEVMLWQQSQPDQRVEGMVYKVELARKWKLHLRDGRELEADFLIDCTGRRAAVTRTQTSRDRVDHLVAAYALLDQEDTGITVTPGTLTETRPDGWWYSSLLPTGQMCVMWFTDTDLLPRGLTQDPAAWHTLLEVSTYTQRRVESAGFGAAEAISITDAGSVRAGQFHGEHWVCAGDAALSFDPLSSHGITSALWSGRKAALASAALLDGDLSVINEYSHTLHLAWNQYIQQKAAMYAVERRFPDNPFWLRRLHVHAHG